MEQLWKSVLAEIELEVSKPVFHTFFKGTSLISIENSVATISALTQITAEYIEKRYYGLLKRILDKKTGENMSLIFVSQGKQNTQKKTHPGPLFAKDLIKPVREKPSRIRQDYTFETFAVSESNQLAYTAATTIASSPGGIYNPLFLYGTVGVGKTHLMHSVANKSLNDHPDTKVLYATTEEFTNEVVEAIRDKTTPQLRKKFRNIDLLLVDDIQFLTGKERVQEELFHTFNTLIDKGKQVIFSSDRAPHEIKKIETRLASRFEGGLTIDIEPPDFELRTAILLIKSKKYNVNLPLEAAKLVAEKITDTRALEGFLLKLSSVLSTRENGEATMELVQSLLSKQKEKLNIIRPDGVIEYICAFYNIKLTQLKGVKRDAFLVRPRQICMYLLKEEVHLTLVEIGNLLGGRDHTTVLHGVEKIKGLVSSSLKLKEEIMLISQKVKGENPQ